MKESNINIKEKRTDFLSMFKFFWNPTPEEQNEEDTIQNDSTISETDKKALLKALKDADKLSTTLFNEQKKSKVKSFENTKKSSLIQNKQNVNTKKIDIDHDLEK